MQIPTNIVYSVEKKKMTSVDVSNRGFSDADVTTILIPFLLKNPHVTHVNISYSSVTNKSIVLLLQDTSLINLDLSYTHIDDDIALLLANSETIKKLDVSNTGITITGAKVFAKYSKQTHLRCYENNIDEDTLNDIDIRIRANRDAISINSSSKVKSPSIVEKKADKDSEAAVRSQALQSVQNSNCSL